MTVQQEIVSFWRDAGPKKWFTSSEDFDTAIRERFLANIHAARDGALDDWIAEPYDALALILMLDQFPRNVFRNTPDMFVADGRARSVADAAIAAGHDSLIDPQMRAFVYMPFMHAETVPDQERSMDLFTALGAPDNLKAARTHIDIIRRFGRFPHRNRILGRTSTPEEIAFLNDGGFSG